MNRCSLAGWLGLCLLATAVSAADDPYEGLFFPLPDAVVTIDAKTKATALEIIPPCFARETKGTKLEINTTRGWGWVERKQLMTMKEAEKYCDSHKTEAYALFIRSTTHLVKDQADKSLLDLTAAIKADPKFAPAYYSRGGLYAEKQEFAKALADFKEGVKLAPKDLLAANDLAWFRATCPDAKFRDGKEALAEATRICEETGHKQEDFLDTLAASYAEVGDFKNAVEWATKLTKIDPENDEFKDRLKLYKAKKPFRDDGK